MAFSKINGVGGDCRVAVVEQDADVVTGHPGKETVISETQCGYTRTSVVPITPTALAFVIFAP